jgi:hypothetical protein
LRARLRSDPAAREIYGQANLELIERLGTTRIHGEYTDGKSAVLARLR